MTASLYTSFSICIFFLHTLHTSAAKPTQEYRTVLYYSSDGKSASTSEAYSSHTFPLVTANFSLHELFKLPSQGLMQREMCGSRLCSTACNIPPTQESNTIQRNYITGEVCTSHFRAVHMNTAVTMVTEASHLTPPGITWRQALRSTNTDTPAGTFTVTPHKNEKPPML